MTEQTKNEIMDHEEDDFTMLMAFSAQGILSSIPFGVNVDPVQIAAAAKNVAQALLSARNEAMK
jgi:hypothetical protein